MKIELRKPLLSDAKRYCEILDNPEFHYTTAKTTTIKKEKDFLRKLKQRWEDGTEFSFVVLVNNKVIGSCGTRINQKTPHICDIGYFIDGKYWNKGIATKAVELLEKFIVENLDIVRIEIFMIKENIGSQKVAIKSGYKKEGLMKKYGEINGKYYDCYLYAKIIK